MTLTYQGLMQLFGDTWDDPAAEGVNALCPAESFTDFVLSTMCNNRGPSCFRGECDKCKDAVLQIKQDVQARDPQVFNDLIKHKINKFVARRHPRTNETAELWDSFYDSSVQLVEAIQSLEADTMDEQQTLQLQNS